MRKFHLKRGPRKLFLAKLAASFIMKRRIETTVARAKEIRPIVERLLTIAKRQDVRSMRILLSRLPKEAAQKLFYDIAPQYKDRQGGYTRIIRTVHRRKRDSAPMAVIEFV